jgi:hypothetical protein
MTHRSKIDSPMSQMGQTATSMWAAMAAPIRKRTRAWLARTRPSSGAPLRVAGESLALVCGPGLAVEVALEQVSKRRLPRSVAKPERWESCDRANVQTLTKGKRPFWG